MRATLRHGGSNEPETRPPPGQDHVCSSDDSAGPAHHFCQGSAPLTSLAIGTVAPVVTVGGMGVMVLAALASGVVAALLAAGLRHRLGGVGAVAVAGLLWSVVVIAVVTLLPAQWDPGIVPAETRMETCSFDYGGPAPEGFWIFDGTQRLLNTLLFVPAGAFGVLAVSRLRWRGRWWAGVPLGLLVLAAYSVGIEATQLVLARLDRACDVTDVVDNVTGAAVGVGIGLLLAAVLRPWRR